MSKFSLLETLQYPPPKTSPYCHGILSLKEQQGKQQYFRWQLCTL